MRLSLGVPAYNQGNFLRATLDSLLAQDTPFHEIVVSNNHSTDETAEVLAQFQLDHPKRIRVVSPPEHLTAVANWNFTASQLTGNWLSLLSSDDLALPNFNRSLQSAIALSPNAVLAFGAWRNIDPAGNALDDRHLISIAPVTHPPKTIHQQRLGPKGSFAAFALRRDIWQKTGGFPEELALVGDWGMWLLAAACGDIVYTDEVISCYRVNTKDPATLAVRHPIYIADVARVYAETMPRATQLAGLGTPAWIAKSSRYIFREMIANCSREFPPSDRAGLIDAFRAWAIATGETRRFQRFERGELIRNLDPILPAKLIARRIMSTLRKLKP